MTPITLTREHDLAVPADVAWRVLADYDRDPQWRSGVSLMTADPPGLVATGTRTDETIRVSGRTYRNLGEVTAVEPGAHFAWRTTSGAVAQGSRTVVPLDADHCRVRLDLHITPTGLNRVLAPLLRRVLDRNLAGDLGRLQRLLEQPTSQTAPSGTSVGAGTTR